MTTHFVPRSFGPTTGLIVAMSAAIAGLTGCSGKAPPGVSSAPSAEMQPFTKGGLTGPALAYASPGRPVTMSDVAERVAPSVVNVSSSRTVKPSGLDFPFFNDPFFRRFFGQRGGEPEQRQREHGLGSGVVVSRDGLVLTNNHVVEDAEDIKVTTSSKKEFSVKVVGKDEKSDLALLRLEGDVTSLTPLEL